MSRRTISPHLASLSILDPHSLRSRLTLRHMMHEDWLIILQSQPDLELHDNLHRPIPSNLRIVRMRAVTVLRFQLRRRIEQVADRDTVVVLDEVLGLLGQIYAAALTCIAESTASRVCPDLLDGRMTK